MDKPKPMFEFSYPTTFFPRPPFVQIVYDDEPLVPVPLEIAQRYLGFVNENLSYAIATAPGMFMLVLPGDARVQTKTVRAVVEFLINGGLKTRMDDRLSALRVCRWLKIDVLQKALQEHLNKDCTSRPYLIIQCLEEVFDVPENDEFRRQRFDDARAKFSSIVNNLAWTRLNAAIIRELLNDDVKLQANEAEIFNAVLRWLTRNVTQIPAEADRLFQLVRFGGMSTEAKFKCLSNAQAVGMESFVKPYMIEADWYRTCIELNHLEFTELKEFDRTTHFVGEGRRTQAIEENSKQQKREKNGRAVAIVTTEPYALERVMNGKVDAGVWVPRPRFGPKEMNKLAIGESAGILKLTQNPMAHSAEGEHDQRETGEVSDLLRAEKTKRKFVWMK